MKHKLIDHETMKIDQQLEPLMQHKIRLYIQRPDENRSGYTVRFDGTLHKNIYGEYWVSNDQDDYVTLHAGFEIVRISRTRNENFPTVEIK